MEATNQTQLVPQQEVTITPATAFTNAASFELLQRIAKTFGTSAIVPAQYKMKSPQDNEALANCVIAIDMAQRMQANPIMVMQNLYIVHGNPGWSSKFLIACLNGCGKFSPIRYEFKGKENTDEWSCRAYAIDKATGEELKGAWVSIGMAKKEGWYGKTGSKWQTMPELMLQYRAAAFFQRAYAPEISMGLNTAEEYQDEYTNKPIIAATKTDQREVIDATAEVVSAAEPAADQQAAAAELFN